MSVLQSQTLQQLCLLAVVEFLRRRHCRFILFKRARVTRRSFHVQRIIECATNLQLREVNVFFRVEDDLRFDGFDSLVVPVERAVFNVSVDAGETLSQVGEGLEECGAARSWTTLRGTTTCRSPLVSAPSNVIITDQRWHSRRRASFRQLLRHRKSP